MPFQPGVHGMTLYGYARVSVREPEDKNLDLQVERLVRAGCSLGNIRAEEASGARNDRGGLLELLDLVAQGDTLVVTHIDRLSRGLTHGLQVIEGLHRAGVEFRSLAVVQELNSLMVDHSVSFSIPSLASNRRQFTCKCGSADVHLSNLVLLAEGRPSN